MMMRRLPDAFNISLRTGATDGLTRPSATGPRPFFNPTERRASPLPRRLVQAVRLDLIDRMELDRRARRLAEDTAPHFEGQGTPARRT